MALRDLESFGLLPIRKPFVRFNTRSLLPPEKAQALTNIQTQPKDTGSNPNINTVIRFSADLPVNKLYCPKLSCEVFDYICMGLNQPLIGNFTIDIGKAIAAKTKQKQGFMFTSDLHIRILKDILAKTEFLPDNKRASILNVDDLKQRSGIVL